MRRLLLLLGRAVRLRCPRCGATGQFESWLRPKHACPRCGQLIERTEEGYFLGALLVNLVIAEVLPLAAIVFVVVRTWPHSPWSLIMYGGAALAALSPFIFYPFSKLIWLRLISSFSLVGTDLHNALHHNRLEDAENSRGSSLRGPG